jgi:hypothetical protein
MAISPKDCFGMLDKVFPVGGGGLREVPPHCFACPERKACMQKALATRAGTAFREELLDRTPARGIAGRIRRWSKKKWLAEQRRGRGEDRT